MKRDKVSDNLHDLREELDVKEKEAEIVKVTLAT